MKKVPPLATALVGVLTGAVCLSFAALAHHIGMPLSELTREALILGGLASMGVGAFGARLMPTKGEEPKQ
jgi:hypothetical protein